MRFEIQLRIVNDDGEVEQVENIASFTKDVAQLTDLGLTLTDSKDLLGELQRQMVEHQTKVYTSRKRTCEMCNKTRRIKGFTPVTFRTLFGNVPLKSLRFYQCQCQPHESKTCSPLTELLSEHTSPERLYLETKWGSLMSYGMTTKLLQDVLPLEKQLNAASIRNHLLKVAERDEASLGDERVVFIDGCPHDWENLPRPDGPITVGIDGGYIRDWKDKKKKFEVIVGKSLPRDGEDKYFGFTHTYDEKSRRRLFEVLKSQGMQENQQIEFLSDGGDTVRELQFYLNPRSEHYLDWFHITMRITVLGQYIKGVKNVDAKQGEEMASTLDRIKWFLWHGNVYEALANIEDLDWDAEFLDLDYPKLEKLAKIIQEFRVYIENNKRFIPNYGERLRYGERISTSFVESTVNVIVAKRFAKKQQMQWTHRGAHLLLQTRTRVFNCELRARFEQWFPGFDAREEEQIPHAA